ncbi:cysteine/glutathione ABC transporter permease/ATP-binding protein CydD [Ursidibacter maritimus]|uniref:Cysteine/glutathione ABC transporter permease/ATP-binding protein CydD n=1 Tax=Ursidibacter maritimus TaxID=1331689 RepID=A0A949T8G0_9PAST|nr:cysteine/glutathione ABC transporter permease/ATP-binding protein CydD [Ursidibacter maritimus]KAE9538253.1 thiol reductant ABC exporter subunit CydD [Ursidibacter maritimus]MBV6523889.1 cysteine/glutathione ABC transporter permease/ATP-binding protein CydD [Ursidibacter maritimus]MBV6526259.1 cysteine/glutathione ABC transporter permease/ATP-binding protein CydD [Ursidibacter maritimus]MBV6527693.1 cysteine/glutathione ABC transporter permease/ATP-binding protein CydD [Ursidibacter maritimu
MDKQRQKQLQKWLRQQQKIVKKWLYLNVLFGTFSALLVVGQMWFLASMLHKMIMEQQAPSDFFGELTLLLACFIGRALLFWLRERSGFQAGKTLRIHLRQQILDKLAQVGPMTIQQRPAGSWAALMLEQVENIHNFYARYLPQQFLSLITPLVILCFVFPLNWAAGLILFLTLPLLPIFMALVGFKAADANQRNIGVLSRLSGQFLDSLKGLETIRLFGQADAQTEQIFKRTEEFRISTMDVLKMAFLSSAVLEFFTAISIAVMAVYFGFIYLGELDFGYYDVGVSLFIGFFCLMLAPEFYQPLRELGVYYHDKAAAIGAADSIETFLTSDVSTQSNGNIALPDQPLNIVAVDCQIFSPQGTALTEPLNFTIQAQQHIALVGQSGAGKSSLMNMLLGFLPYQGSIKINGVELRELGIKQWRALLAWVGQNPQLIKGSLRENIVLGNPQATDDQISEALRLSRADEFVYRLGLEREIQDANMGISGGQAQRIAIARALLRPYQFLLLDEPTASLDMQSEQQVLAALHHLSKQQTTLMITHRIEDLKQCDEIWVMKQGQIIQQGKFTELEKQGFFAELLGNQELLGTQEIR